MKRVRVNSGTNIPSIIANDVEKGAMIAVGDSAYRLLSITLMWSLLDIADIDDGGLVVGVAHSDYTAAEIEECLEATGAISRGDKLNNERASRLVRVIGQFGNSDTVLGDLVLNDGRPITTKLNWPIEIGKQVNYWWLNASGTTFNTAKLTVNGTCVVRYT